VRKECDVPSEPARRSRASVPRSVLTDCCNTRMAPSRQKRGIGGCTTRDVGSRRGLVERLEVCFASCGLSSEFCDALERLRTRCALAHIPRSCCALSSAAGYYVRVAAFHAVLVGAGAKTGLSLITNKTPSRDKNGKGITDQPDWLMLTPLWARGCNRWPRTMRIDT